MLAGASDFVLLCIKVSPISKSYRGGAEGEFKKKNSAYSVSLRSILLFEFGLRRCCARAKYEVIGDQLPVVSAL
jgi:hypothetical protein